MSNSACFCLSKFATSEQTAHILKCETVPYPTRLCQWHYHFVYDTLQSKYTHCCTCNSALRNVRKCVCPNSEVIQQYLARNTGFEGSIPTVKSSYCLLIQIYTIIIGLLLNHKNKDIMIQISPYNSRDLCFLYLPALITALRNDPDLSSILY